MKIFRIIIFLLIFFIWGQSFVISNEIDYSQMDREHINNKELTKNIYELEREILANPNNSEAYFSLAKAYSSQENFKKAITYLEKAIQLQPRNEEYLSYLVGLYCAEGELEKAMQALKQLDQINPDRQEIIIEIPLKKLLSIIDNNSLGVVELGDKPFDKIWKITYTKMVSLNAPFAKDKDLEELKDIYTSMINAGTKNKGNRIYSFSQHGHLIRYEDTEGAVGAGVSKDKWFAVFIPPVEFGKVYIQSLIWGEIKEGRLIGTELMKVFSDKFFSEDGDPKLNYEVELNFIGDVEVED